MSKALWRLGIEPHMIVMSVVFLAALGVGYALLPGENERVAMLERDGKNRQALRILESRFDAGDRRARTLYQLVGLYEQFGNLPRLKLTLEALAAARPRDVQVRRRLVQFYSATQDNTSYLAALEQEIDVKYSETACKELIGLHRMRGEFAKEQAAVVKCRQRGYRRAEDIVRLAGLVAADGDFSQAAQLLRSVDDLKRLKSDRERLQLFTMLIEADQPREALRRAVRWVKASRDQEFTLTLVETLVRRSRHDVAIELARDTSVQGDPVSLAVAEVMLDRGETAAARSFLRGWVQSMKAPTLDTALRFVDSALDAEDADAAYQFATHYGLTRLPQTHLVALAEALSVVGLKRDVDTVRLALTPETLASNPLLGAVEELEKGQREASRELLDRVEPDKLDDWKLTLWARLMRETGREAEARRTLTTLGIEPSRVDDPVAVAAAAAAAAAAGSSGAGRPATVAAVAARPAAEPVSKVLRRKKKQRQKRIQVRTAASQQSPAAKEAAAKEAQKSQSPKGTKTTAPFGVQWPFGK